jgi:integrase
MGVKVREKPPGSGIFWVFINHNSKRKSKKIGMDEDLAKEVAEKIKAKLVLGELDIEKIEEPCPIFKEYSELFLSLPHDWKESTQTSYKHNLNKHVYPVFGKQRIGEIRRKDLKAFFDKLLINGLSSATISLVKAPINGVLSFAVDSEIIENNPLDGIKLKRKNRDFKVEPLTEDEAGKLLDEAKM